MDDEIYDDGRESHDELLAEGEYESDTETIMKGFKLFQKKYVYKGIILQMLLVVLAIASQIMNIASAKEGEDVSFSYLLTVLCIVLAGYILIRPKNSYRKLENSIKELSGTVYKAEIYKKKIVITTIFDPSVENEEKEELPEDEKNEEIPDETDQSEEYKGPPATVIHLDNCGVEIIESSDIYMVYIKKINMYVIPKKAFKPYENTAVKDKLSNIMGVRYIIEG